MNIVKKAGLAALMAFVMLFVLVPVFAEETDKANAVAYVTRKDSDQAEYFDTLQSALNAVQDGGSVVLLQDITGNGPSFRVGGGKSFSFDLAGHEIRYRPDGNPNFKHLFIIDNSRATLSIKNSSDRAGLIKGQFTGVSIFYLNTGTLEFGEHNSYIQTPWQHFLVYNKYGHVVINGGSLEGLIALNREITSVTMNGGILKHDSNKNCLSVISGWDNSSQYNRYHLKITGGTIIGTIEDPGRPNQRRNGFITGGLFSGRFSGAKPEERYIHPDYKLVETQYMTEKGPQPAWQVVKK